MINQNLYFVKAKISKEWMQERNNAQGLESDWAEGCLEIANDRRNYNGGMFQYRVKPPKTYLFSFPIEPETICKSIGMEDTYGKSIYEKDVVEITSYSGTKDRYLIWWNQEMSMMTAIPIKELEFNGNDYYCSRPNFTYDKFCIMMQNPCGDFEKVEVVGNIIDEPELINTKPQKSDSSIKVYLDMGPGFPLPKINDAKETDYEF